MTCDDYLLEPEANAAHLESCDSCRAIARDLDELVVVEPRSMNVDELPVAGWEAASHRTWPLVAAGLVAVLVLAMLLFLAAGMSPFGGIVRSITAAVPSLDLMLDLSQLAGGAIHNAPPAWHIVIGISFVVINTLLFLLLRRAPKGIDV